MGMTQRQWIDHCLALPGTYEDYPFDDTPVLRHRSNRKMFALFIPIGGRPSINLKCDPMWADFLRGAYTGVIPGYHMNKVHWNTVDLDGDVPQGEIKNMIKHSYDLTK